MKKEYKLENITCAHCMSKIESEFSRLDYVKQANLDLLSKTIRLDIDSDIAEDDLKSQLNSIAEKIEPGTKVVSFEDELSDNKDQLAIIVITAIAYIATYFIKSTDFKTLLLLFLYVYIGHEVLIKAFKSILNRNYFDESILMSIATLGAIALSFVPDVQHYMNTGHVHIGATNELPEAVTVMLLYQIGEYIQGFALNKSKQSLKGLLSLKNKMVSVKDSIGIKECRPQEVRINDFVLVKGSELVLLDGKLMDDTASFDVSSITGEPLPQIVNKGDKVISGSINIGNPITVRVSNTFENSNINMIITEVDKALSRKGKSEKFITAFSKVYTPIILIMAIIVAFIVPLVIEGGLSYTYIYRALVFLVMSCPCSLVISIPLSFYLALDLASRNKILFKGSEYFEKLANSKNFFFDKTGTITTGNFKVSDIINYGDIDTLMIAAAIESYSDHPIGKAIAIHKSNVDVSSVEEIRHQGMRGIYNNQELLVGNQYLFEHNNIKLNEEKEGNKIYVGLNGTHIGTIHLIDEIKYSAYSLFDRLDRKRIQILSGDQQDNVDFVMKQLKIGKGYGHLLPGDKADIIKGYDNTVFIGDGFNDALVMSNATVSIAMGVKGSDIALEAADIVIMNDDLDKVYEGIDIAKRTIRLIKQNLVLIIGIKTLVLTLGLFGIFNMWMAIFADVGVTMLVIANAFRIYLYKKR